jgi:excisionase family DNA binding protein
MASATELLMEPIRPSDEDVRLAQNSSSQLSRFNGGGAGAVTFTVRQDRDAEEVTIPGVAFRMLGLILNELAQGHSIALNPVDRLVSTQKAADVLNVSRPYLVKLLESGKIPFSKAGAHRRVRLADVLEYKARMDAEADRAYEELVAQAQELGLGYT